MRSFIALCALAATSCFSPDLTNARFSCSEEVPECPIGFVCLQSFCQPLSTLDNLPGDGGTDPPTGSTGAVGCASGLGYDVAKDPTGAPVFACPGKWSWNGNVRTLCAAGYQICTDANRIDNGKCEGPTQGFYVAQVSGERDNAAMRSVCGRSNDGAFREDIWAGCGKGGPPVIMNLSMPCSGFTKARLCSSDFGCGNDASLDLTYSNDSKGGVLCCKQ